MNHPEKLRWTCRWRRASMLAMVLGMAGMAARAGEVAAWGEPEIVSALPEGLTDVVAVAAGHAHGLALLSDGSVVGWGDDSFGQATPPEGLHGVAAIAAGPFHSLALRVDGTVVGWGRNRAGEVPPREPGGLTNLVAIAAGEHHGLGLRADGTVVAWGYGAHGEAEAPAGLSGVVAIAAGHHHNLALLEDGTAVGWGDDSEGQATPPAGLSHVVAIAAGRGHSLALLADGTVTGWGDDSLGQATPPEGLRDVVAIAAGGDQSLALLADGTVVGWGDDRSGQGRPPTGLTGVTAIAAGGLHSVALTEPSAAGSRSVILEPPWWIAAAGLPFQHRVRAWGRVERFEADGLPAGMVLDPVSGWVTGQPQAPGEYDVPLRVVRSEGAAETTVRLIVLAAPPFVRGEPVIRAALNAGFAYRPAVFEPVDAWQVEGLPPGLAMDGETGWIRGTPVAAGVFPVTVRVSNADGEAVHSFDLEVWPFLSRVDFGWGGETRPEDWLGVVTVAVGDDFLAGLKADGTVVTAPASRFQGPPGRTVPPPAGLAEVTAVAAGRGHVLALRADGTVVGWGDNTRGQAVPPEGLADVVAIAAAGDQSLALRANGTVVGWGANERRQSAPLEGLTGVVAVAAGGQHGLALLGNGTVVGWGDNRRGQSEPPEDLSGVMAIAAGAKHSLALLADGTVVGWGDDSRGQAAPPEGLGDVVAIAAAGDLSVALRSDGSVVAWGLHRGVPSGLKGLRAIGAGERGWVGLTDASWQGGPPVFAESRWWLAAAGASCRRLVQVGNGPERIEAAGLPAGLALDPATHLIAGVPEEPGEYAVRLTAVNQAGAAVHEVRFLVFPQPPLVWDHEPVRALIGAETALSMASHFPIEAWEAEGLPAGMWIDGATGRLEGRPWLAGEYRVTVRARNRFGTGEGRVTLRVERMVAWGANATGGMALPDEAGDVLAVALGAEHGLALRADGSVIGWGANTDGQATPPPGLKDVRALAAGGRHSLALLADGRVVGWGNNARRQVSPPEDLRDAVAIAAGGDHSLALRADGTVVGWGDNDFGQAVPPADLIDVVAIAAGGRHSLALRVDGAVVGWGDNRFGQSSPPPGLGRVVAIAAGENHSLALLADGTVTGWGDNQSGQAVPPADLTDVVAIAAGARHSVALRRDGSLAAWGNNDFGQADQPREVRGLTAIEAGGNANLAFAALPRWMPTPRTGVAPWGARGRMRLWLEAGAGIATLRLVVRPPADQLTDWSAVARVAEMGMAEVTPLDGGMCEVILRALPGRSFSGPAWLADLTARLSGRGRTTRLRPELVSAVAWDGDGRPVAAVVSLGSLVALGAEPWLDTAVSGDGRPVLILYGFQLRRYWIETRPVLGGGAGGWQRAAEVTVPRGYGWSLAPVEAGGPTAFWRAVLE